MEDTIVSFKTAKLAKEKGFSAKDTKLIGYTSKFYNHNTKTLLNYGRTGRTDLNKAYFAPTQSLLRKWLRDRHNLHIEISPNAENEKIDYKIRWDYALYELNTDEVIWVKKEYETIYKTYEEALEIGLQNGLKYIENE